MEEEGDCGAERQGLTAWLRAETGGSGGWGPSRGWPGKLALSRPSEGDPQGEHSGLGRRRPAGVAGAKWVRACGRK